VKVTTLLIHMADDEWGNELMYKLAEDAIRAHPECECLVVKVYEHAGWFLQFAMLNGELKVVGTANDGAVFSDEVRAFHRLCRDLTFEELPYIRRQNAVDAQVKAAKEWELAVAEAVA